MISARYPKIADKLVTEYGPRFWALIAAMGPHLSRNIRLASLGRELSEIRIAHIRAYLPEVSQCRRRRVALPMFPSRYPKLAGKLSTSQGSRFRALIAAKDSPFIAPFPTLLLGSEIIQKNTAHSRPQLSTHKGPSPTSTGFP